MSFIQFLIGAASSGAISFESFPCSHKERTSTAGANPRTNSRGEAAQKFRDCFVTAFLAMTLLFYSSTSALRAYPGCAPAFPGLPPFKLRFLLRLKVQGIHPCMPARCFRSSPMAVAHGERGQRSKPISPPHPNLILPEIAPAFPGLPPSWRSRSERTGIFVPLIPAFSRQGRRGKR